MCGATARTMRCQPPYTAKYGQVPGGVGYVPVLVERQEVDGTVVRDGRVPGSRVTDQGL